MASPRLPEAFVWWLWQNALAGRHLTSAAGQPIHVIYPGRRWGSWGPDFRGALISLNGEILRGDIEVHVRARDWFAHGHDRDSAYNATILHVVFHARGVDPDAEPPVVAIEPQLRAPVATLLEQWQGQKGRQLADACLSLSEAQPLLRAAGLARLQSKAARFEGDLQGRKPETALLVGLIEGLGYAANVGPMRALLDRVSVEWLRDYIQVEGQQISAALLFGQAGLLPSQRGRLPLDDYSLDIERIWRARTASPSGPGLRWRWLGARPANTPQRRVAAALALLRNGGELGERTLGALVELPPAAAVTAIRGLLTQSGDAYWRAHSDFGRVMRTPSALLGAERAADLVVNVVLPWAIAVAHTWTNPALEQAAIDVYEAHPGLGLNQITRHMAEQVLGDHAAAGFKSACLQQGLIQLYRGWCDARDCFDCPARMVELATISGGH